MTSLVIDLQEGFSGDTVSIKVDGAEVFRKSGVTTDYSIGRADSVKIESVKSPASVAVDVPSRDLTSTTSPSVNGTLYLGVYVDNGKIVYRTSNEMFKYF